MFLPPPHFCIPSRAEFMHLYPRFTWYTSLVLTYYRFGCSQQSLPSVRCEEYQWQVSTQCLLIPVHLLKMEHKWGVGHQHCVLAFVCLDLVHRKCGRTLWDPCRDRVRWNGHWAALLRPLLSGNKHMLCPPSKELLLSPQNLSTHGKVMQKSFLMIHFFLIFFCTIA